MEAKRRVHSKEEEGITHHMLLKRPVKNSNKRVPGALCGVGEQGVVVEE